MKQIDASSLLNQMKALSIEAQASKQEAVADTTAAGGFKDLLKNALEKVNETQITSSEMSKSFAMGDPNVSIPETMIAIQKSQISLQMLTGVRDQMVRAYHDIFNMPI